MARKNNSMSAFYLYMLETQKLLAEDGITMSMCDMPNYCQKDWNEMPDYIKEGYKIEAKKRKLNSRLDKVTSVGRRVEDVQKEMENSKMFADAMYSYIEELVRMDHPLHFIPKQKFILIHINSYTCVSDRYYFPAEITLAEFSLEKGIIRIFHELLGYDKYRTFAPIASLGDINVHAKNNHQITTFRTLPSDYKATFLKLIGFIVGQEVDETTINDPSFDMPPIFSSHGSDNHNLSATTASLYQLYKSAISYPAKDFDDFSKMLKVYQLEKLLMEIKNTAHSLVNPDSDVQALPSVALASTCLSKYMFGAILSIGCSFHDENNMIDICSTYFICKWIYVFAANCCSYFNIKLQPGCHFDFDISDKTDDKCIHDVTDTIDKIKISNNYVLSHQNQPKESTVTNKFPALNSVSPVVKQSPWGKQSTSTLLPIQPHMYNNNFPSLSSSQKTITRESSKKPAKGSNHVKK